MSRLKRWQTSAEVVSHRKAQAKYEASPVELKKRENRNKARLTLERSGKVKKGDGKDVGHRDGSALHNDPTNWIVENRRKNRSYKRTPGAHKEDPTS